ncbi:hypothetical protein D7X33_41070 [Butyricicoccus sp. 1XD8-22]|nr:hypothetical protein D7X33_41070 [Butyricicoccus sp. 1XD8-22]
MTQINIPYLQIGEYRIETPIGLSELLQPAWSKQKDDDDVKEFATQYERTVFRNSEGRLVTKYVKRGNQS